MHAAFALLHMPTLFVSLSSSSTDPGRSIARALRDAGLDLSLTAVSRAPHGPALAGDVWDDVWRCPTWAALNPEVHAAEIAERLGEDTWLLPTSAAESHWLAHALPSTDRVLGSSSDALARTTLPVPAAVEALPVSIPDWLPLSAPVEDLHAFGRRHDWNLWMRTPLGDRRALDHWLNVHQVRSELSERTRDPEALFLQRQVDGTVLSLPFAAHEGTLLDAALIRPDAHRRATHHVERVPDDLRAALRDVLSSLDWMGGGTLSLIEAADGTHWLDAWQPCFGAEVAGTAQCGPNLPAQLLAACIGAEVPPASPSATVFSRITTTVLASPPPDDASVPKAASTVDAGPPRPASVRPSGPSGTTELDDDLRAILDDLPNDSVTGDTPRSVLLPTRTRERFAAFTDAADRIEGAFDLDTAHVGLSIKTNPAARLLDTARTTGMLAETIHPDEMDHARRHGYATNEIIVNGPVQALLPNLDTAPYALFGDAVKDLRALPFDPSSSIIGVRTRPPERGPSRFGVDLSDADRMNRLCDRLAALPSATRIGLHLHAPSSTLGHNRWWASVERVLSWAQTIQTRTGRPVECLDLGGGWHPDDWLDVFVPDLLDRRGAIQEALPALNTILLEPGKALSQPLGVVVSQVLDTRPTRSAVILDASLAELSNIDYHPHRLLAHTDERGWHRLPRGEGRLLGRLCMEADILGRRRQVDHLSPGDPIVVCDAGAYDASMTYPFGRGATATP